LIINRLFKNNQFLITSIPILKDIPIGLRSDGKFILNDGELLIQYVSNGILLKQFLLDASRKKRIIIAMKFIDFILCLDNRFTFELDPNNYLIDRSLSIKSVHLGIKDIIIPLVRPEFKQIKIFCIYIIHPSINLEAHLVGSPLLKLSKFENELLTAKDLHQLKEILFSYKQNAIFKRIKKYEQFF
jgi:uncharacterized membrane protein YukC